MTMASAAKRQLSSTIRQLRTRLLDELRDATRAQYRLDISRIRDAGLDEASAARRRRLESWLDEQVRAEAASKSAGKGKKSSSGKKGERQADEFLRDVEKQAAYTLLNRLVVLRLMEATGSAGGEERLRKRAVVTGGWESEGYKTLRQLAPALAKGDATEGYAFLLKLVFEDLAIEMPGLFGPGIADLVPIPPATLRTVVDALDEPGLESCWTDDMTLGWVYQYWNDPEREALDEKLHARQKLDNHEIAAKTQMFTERYMVDWLLQNSLGPMWLATCAKNDWTPEVVAHGVLDALEERRTDWRAKREAGEVELAALMPLHSDVERRWAYYVPPESNDDTKYGVPTAAVEHAPASIRELKLIDPAVGSGHFLVVATELLFHLYLEEARHRGRADAPEWKPLAIVERILEHNLHGVDLDPRAVQIAAAALWLKAQQLGRGAQPRQLNLVASDLRLGGLPDDDPALVELRTAVESETGIPPALTDTLIMALRGADHLGSLLKVDRAVESAIEAHEKAGGVGRYVPTQSDFFRGTPQQASIAFDAAQARVSLLDQLEGFLARHTAGDDLGLRLRGEQLAAGVRFVRTVREGSYHLVVANPPYQGTSKMADAKYVEGQYVLGKADLFAAFLLRGLELAREGGISAMLTMRNWMFIKQYAKLREHLLETYDLRALGDFEVGAFEEIGGYVVSVAVSVFQKADATAAATALKLTAEDIGDSGERTQRKRAATLCHVGRHTFDPAALKVVPEWPLVYWWDKEFLRRYSEAPKLEERSPARFGINTGNNIRFLRWRWEAQEAAVPSILRDSDTEVPGSDWQRYLKGAAGLSWVDPCDEIAFWRHNGLMMKVYAEWLYGSYSRQIRNERVYFRPGVAFTMIGSSFSGRLHRWKCIIDSKGSSVYPDNLPGVVCLMNRDETKKLLSSLNPTLSCQVGDVNRIAILTDLLAEEISGRVEGAFAACEQHRETSAEYRRVGPWSSPGLVDT